MGRRMYLGLNRTVREYRKTQHTTGEKLIALADQVRSAEQKGFILSLVKGVLIVASAMGGERTGVFAKTASRCLPEEDKEAIEKELREAEQVLQHLFNETHELARIINRRVLKKHQIKLTEDGGKIPKERYRKYNKGVRCSVDTIHVTLDVMQISRPVGVAGGGSKMASTEGKYILLQTAIDIFGKLVREATDDTVSAKLVKIGNTLKGTD